MVIFSLLKVSNEFYYIGRIEAICSEDITGSFCGTQINGIVHCDWWLQFIWGPCAPLSEHLLNSISKCFCSWKLCLFKIDSPVRWIWCFTKRQNSYKHLANFNSRLCLAMIVIRVTQIWKRCRWIMRWTMAALKEWQFLLDTVGGGISVQLAYLLYVLQ